MQVNPTLSQGWRSLLAGMTTAIAMAALPPHEIAAAPVFETELDPVYLRWFPQPCEMLGFWYARDPEETARRTGANAFSRHVSLSDVVDADEQGTLTLRNVFRHAAGPTEGNMVFGAGFGEHNNPFFVHYPPAFVRTSPGSFMQAIDGSLIRTGEYPVPAMDDATLTHLSCELIAAGAGCYAAHSGARYWVVGGEQSYPDYFGLPAGDFREASRRHFALCARMHKWDALFDTAVFQSKEGAALRSAWALFREEAAAERIARYYQAFVSSDTARPVLCPTHGNPFFERGRAGIGHVPGRFAQSCDGFETGQIMIDDDAECLNLLTLAHLSAYRKPVVSPRLACKSLDAKARGGGRSFTPWRLRRTVFECLGMGVPHAGLVQWEGDLDDGEWHIKETAAEREAHAVFEELKGVAPWLAGMARLQPRIGLYVSDATWLQHGWSPQWTWFFQDALAARCHIAVVGDEAIESMLARRMPVLISIGNGAVSRGALASLRQYEQAGGTVCCVGNFAAESELGQPLLPSELPKFVRLDDMTSAGERQLVNMSSTLSGAHQEAHSFRPVMFEAVAREIASRHGESILRPVSVETSSSAVHAHFISDRRTLACVLLNHGETSAEVTLRPPVTDGSGQQSAWSFRVILPSQLRDTDSTSSVQHLRMEPKSTAMVWITPQSHQLDLAGMRSRAERAIAAWARLDADCAVQNVLFELMRGDGGRAAGEAKAAALYDVICPRETSASCVAAVALRVTAQCHSGGIKIAVNAYDAAGAPVSGARVFAVLVPGDGTMYPLFSESSDKLGCYGLNLPTSALPRLYDAEKGIYGPLVPPMRVVVSAFVGEAQAGAISTIESRQEDAKP